MKQVEVSVLAGGRGTRMRHGERREFREIPKIFIPIAYNGQNESLFFHVLTGVASISPGSISILAGEHPECGPAYLRAEAARVASETGAAVLWDPADKPLGTAGALYQAAKRSRFPIIVAAPADTLFPFQRLPDAVTSHVAKGSQVTWVVTSSAGEGAQNLGRLVIDNRRGRLLISGEDPRAAADLPDLGPGTSAVTSTGVAIFRTAFYQRAFFGLTRPSRVGPVDIYRDLMSFLLSGGHRVDVFDIGQPAPDLGTPDRFIHFERAQVSEGWTG